ncbi:type I polyketide synthase [Streptomyces zagrosensis]|uniref:Acyl transferase domain-containing protein/acyl carrier protein/ubiquinone/menaquinone biosynthesis C-methylase UbiE n=1 Tax=Streptomyces zagrosensis TaxID=1042984 RepID=A0A7W9V0S4_9ACTN|nr:type I polyketide synthase [Streptomyces zagrosensis]MBB5938430.1 acyl transferase domain-containing protein/acyl carrier protein/ubiquinone/menaquinone biosynthesis C-methylase UbiE [Streptomyces zagrosensis]
MTQQPAHPDALRQGIAIIGASCRLPGGIHGLDALWDALLEERNAIGEVPADRFDARRIVTTDMARTGKSYTAAGGFLDDVAGFDAAYFGISPKEAAHMDPQHRLLLELTAEALDDAALAPDQLAGSDTAVYVGISDASYGMMQMLSLHTVNPYTMSGAASSVAANRLSHAFDLRGPSLAVDTACSSSLVALDRACRTLREGSSRTALCGGANLLLSPYHYVAFSQASMLSRTGRCAAFSADADGFVRAEGGGVVVLKRLPDALADGDRVLGVILGSGSNSDGHTMGLALPSAAAQEELLVRVYSEAGIDPDDVVYFEAHGTGTPVGDPLEAQAIGRALGVRRIVGALPIGSIKTNVGHLEPASGMAGLCKALLVLRHGVAPASLHAETPHPDINFDGLGLSLNARTQQLPTVARPVVGVNSFGFGGANAHVALTAAPSRHLSAAPAPPPEGLPLMASGRTPQAMVAAAVAMAQRLSHADEEEFYDLAYTSCRRRGLHEHRATVLAHSPKEAAQSFAALAGHLGQDTLQAPAGTVEAEAPASAAVAEEARGGHVTFVFSGNGSQWAGMGADLLADPVFRTAVEDVDRELVPRLGWSVLDTLGLPADTWRLDATEIAQPLLFAVQVGIAAVLRAQGIVPAMVLGHSVGEVAAAYSAGALTLAEAAQVITERSRVQAATAGTGRMAAVGLCAENAADEIATWDGALEIAAVNSPLDVTVAGDAEALAELGARLTDRGVFFRDLELDYAFHSRAMDPQREPLTTALRNLEPREGDVPLYSTVTGCSLPGSALDADYWWHNVRRPVLFAAAVERVIDDGGDIFVEIGPHPVLRTYLRRISTAQPGTSATLIPTLSRKTEGRRALSVVPAALIAAGATDTDWERYFPRPGHVTTLPAYPWQRERHWNGDPDTWYRHGALVHPLLGSRVGAPHPVWEGTVEPGLVPWLADHRVAGSVVMPATGYAEMALAAGRQALGTPVEVEHLDIQSALVVPWPEAPTVSIQAALHPDSGTFTLTSTTTGNPQPRTHVQARIRALLHPRPANLDLNTLGARCPRHLNGQEHYAACAAAGLTYGPTFQVLTSLDVGDGEALARYRHDAPGQPYTIHPALLDGALQAGAPLLPDFAADQAVFLPASIGALRVWGDPTPTGVMRVRERSRTAHEVCWDIVVADDEGQVTAQLDGCRLRRVTATGRTPITVHQTELRAAPRPDSPAALSPLPAPQDIGQAAAHRIAQLREQLPDRCAQLLQMPGEVVARRTASAIAAMLADPAAPFTMACLVTAGVLEKHTRLLALVLPEMQRLGLVVANDPGEWQLTPTDRCTDHLLRDIVNNAPDSTAAVSLCARLNANFEALLRGAQDPLDLIVEEHTAQALEHFYDLLPPTRFCNRVAQALLREIVAKWPEGRTLRVLEVGAGTGTTAAAMLPLLPPDRTRYCFSDISASVFPRAQNRFTAYDFVEYRTFDLSQSPAAQGLTPHSFDLVVAGVCLHTAPVLADALHNVADLLAPGGHLLATEAHNPQYLLPYFGFLDSFYSTTDTELRPHSRVLSRDSWPDLLRRCGFSDVLQTGHDKGPLREDFSVLLAATSPRPLAQPPNPTPQRADTSAFVLAVESVAERKLAEAVSAAITQAGGTARTAEMTSNDGDWTEMLSQVHTVTGTERRAVVLILAQTMDEAPQELTAVAGQRAAALRALMLAVNADPQRTPPELWLVTRPCGTMPAPGTPQELDAALWGMTRSLVNEIPGLTSHRIALERTADTKHDADRLTEELLRATEEDEVLLTAADRFVPRESHRRPARPVNADASFTLRVDNPGLSYRLAWQQQETPQPGPGEILLEVRAAALNYRDLMQAVGLLPTEAIEGTPSAKGCGLECAGVVIACGEGVTQLSPGDRVAGMAPASLASHTVTNADSVWPLADQVPFAAAATMPVAFTTVHYSLGHLARLQPGETVLVHGAAGGVGLAAIQYAHAHGAHVIATAGSDLKRELLRSLGVQHVLDSRTLDFAVHVQEITEGRGVDIVLNSLAGEAIGRSLELLRPGGRFLELGKRDIYENKPLALRPFRNNIAFFGVDLTKLLLDKQQAQAALSDLFEDLKEDRFRPLLHTVYPAARVAEAFQLMQHSRHIGKVVVAFDPLDEPPLVEPISPPFRLDGAATYLVTGGTGGFGAATARWLADHGARHVALVSRRGAQSPEADEVLAALTARHVTATAYSADVTDLAAMRAVAARIAATGHPLRGAVHCAMHLDDALFTELDEDRIAAVLAPKITGAAVLDLLLRDSDCDLFLMYSSAAATVGNIKQAAYVAGNVYLEALVRRRRRQGLAGLAVAWGAIGDTGYVARSNLHKTLTAIGFEAFTSQEALAAATTLMGTDIEVAGVLRCNWSRGMKMLAASMTTPRLSALVPKNTEGGFDREELVHTLAEMQTEDSFVYLTDALVTVMTDILHMDSSQFDPHRRLDTYGLDSLMATELLVTLNERFAVDIPPMELLRSSTGTLADVAQTVYLRLGVHTADATFEATIPHQAKSPDGDPTNAPID